MIKNVLCLTTAFVIHRLNIVNTMYKPSPQCKVRQCSQCPENSVYICLQSRCKLDLCIQCKNKHVTDLSTKHHKVVIYQELFSTDPKTYKHFDRYCGTFDIPLINNCADNEEQGILDIREAYKKKRHQHTEFISMLRSDALFYTLILLSEIKTGYGACHKQFSILNSILSIRATRLNCFIDTVSCFYNNLIAKKCNKRNEKIYRYLANIQRYEHTYEQSSVRPVQFLLFLRVKLSKRTSHSPYFGKYQHVSITESLNKMDVLELLSGIQMKEGRKRIVMNERLLKLLPVPELHNYFYVDGNHFGTHITFASSNLIWASDFKNIKLTNTTGKTLYCEKLLQNSTGFDRIEVSGVGQHTVNSDNELIFVDMSKGIYKLSKDMKTRVTYISRKDSIWKPRCLFWSPSSGDLLAGMGKYKTKANKWIGRVHRYSQAGKLIQTIQHDNKGKNLYREPYFIKENTNEDVVVSDFGHAAIIVTGCRGNHRFSYTGPPSGPKLTPRGVCTDALSHILVSDYETHTIHMLDKDGRFLSHLLTRSDDDIL